MQKQSGPPEKIVALLGRRDTPTDGVEDYCQMLGEALLPHGYELEMARTSWEQLGWGRALARFWKSCEDLRGKWILLQYTALSWSRRGFPFGVLAVARIAKHHGAKLAVVFHESSSAGGKQLSSNWRQACQLWVIRRLYSLCDRAIFTVPTRRLPWLPKNDSKSRFIPLGANICPPPSAPKNFAHSSNGHRTVGVFCITGSGRTDSEIQDISAAVRQAKQKLLHVRLCVLGRGSAEAREQLQQSLANSGVELSVLGILPAGEAAEVISQFDALCYVRGEVSLQRSCALTAVACNVPLVGYGEAKNCSPLDEAGIVLVPPGNRKSLGNALETVLLDKDLRARLRQRNAEAHEKYFSWKSIAHRYAEALRHA